MDDGSGWNRQLEFPALGGGGTRGGVIAGAAGTPASCEGGTFGHFHGRCCVLVAVFPGARSRQRPVVSPCVRAQ